MMNGNIMGLGSAESINQTDKSEFVNSIMWQLPAEVQAGLQSGKLQLVPYHYYGCKEITGMNHVNIFESGDFTIKGVTNVVQGRIPADDHFMVSKLRCRTFGCSNEEVNSRTPEQLMKDADWDEPFSCVTNGEFMFGSGATTYMDKTATAIFDTKGNTTIEKGTVKIPGKYLKPQTELKVEFDIVGSLPKDKPRAFIRFDVIGVKTQKA